MNNRAVVVLSGGLDSSTCMGIAKKKGYEIYPITFSYGQRHDRELNSAISIAEYYKCDDHKIVDINFLSEIGGSSLTDKSLEIRENELSEDIPNTYVPARNLIFLSLAIAYAETIDADYIYIGVNSLDYSGYPDCRPEFIDSIQNTARLATKRGVNQGNIIINTPLMDLDKKQIVKLGVRINVPFELTTSCYIGEDEACGVCDSCLLRIQGFQQNNYVDPIKYMSKNEETFK
ncbi:7-cyano-7-deazaguanine synthase QueC [Shouchella miscanthi]|uniref:7-cyano-7-deazaguanine synthase n=1 Tax=Shouchella miscanthi TaxID=2598861 RepID=A0ABU6NEW5_9BACI|nr:7-cyano-7-deazaguanine synthase QueC [Shouchella miscanthi]MED4126733.1 7-cyano-7-deazaguanine synthase QueC [Shouchella miscanthi]